MLGALGLALYAAFTAEQAAVELGLAGGVATCVLVAAFVLRLDVLVGPALLLLGAEYAAYFAVRGETIDIRAPAYGACFLAVAELAYAALELRAGAPEPGLTARRILALTAVALGSIVAGMVVLGAAATPLDGGLGLSAAGIVAAVLLLVGLGRLAGRAR